MLRSEHYSLIKFNRLACPALLGEEYLQSTAFKTQLKRQTPLNFASPKLPGALDYVQMFLWTASYFSVHQCTPNTMVHLKLPQIATRILQ